MFCINVHAIYIKYIAPELQYIYIYITLTYRESYHVDSASCQALNAHSYIRTRSKTSLEIVSGKP
jgi:hypothetical protein